MPLQQRELQRHRPREKQLQPKLRQRKRLLLPRLNVSVKKLKLREKPQLQSHKPGRRLLPLRLSASVKRHRQRRKLLLNQARLNKLSRRQALVQQYPYLDLVKRARVQQRHQPHLHPRRSPRHVECQPFPSGAKIVTALFLVSYQDRLLLLMVTRLRLLLLQRVK